MGKSTTGLYLIQSFLTDGLLTRKSRLQLVTKREIACEKYTQIFMDAQTGICATTVNRQYGNG